jgi:autoinducer 2 (AI-2) kinase
MGKNCILTIDVGTGSGRAILFDREGRQLAAAKREWLPEKRPEYPGAQNFDTESSWKLLAECAREAIAGAEVEPSGIAGVTATSMREGMVLYDRDRKEIWSCTNADARARQEVGEMVDAGMGEPIYRTGGDWLNIISPPRFRWIRKHLPRVYDRIAFMNMLSDWVLYRLSGEIVTEPTCGSSSGIFDLKRRCWSEDLIGLADLPEKIYPPVFEPAIIIGRVSKGAAEETGLREGTPVITAGGDTQLALLGTGAVAPGTFTIVGGTFWQTTVTADWPLIDPQFRLRTLCHAVPGQWMVEGIGFYHGFVMRWFRDGFCTEEKRRAAQSVDDAYSLMEEMAENIPPGSNGVQAIFSDLMNARQWKHAVPSFVGFDIMDAGGTGKAACIRAIEENAAYTSRGHLEILREISGYTTDTATFCGGSSRGRLWPRILADVLNVRIKIPVVKESTALGSVMCAGVALGWFEDLMEASSGLVKWEREVSPSEETVPIYSACYEKWRQVYPYILSLADDGVLPSMWRAPGI